MTAWQDAGAGARPRGGETHPKVLLADGGKTPQRTETGEGAGGLRGAPSLTRS